MKNDGDTMVVLTGNDGDLEYAISYEDLRTLIERDTPITVDPEDIYNGKYEDTECHIGRCKCGNIVFYHRTNSTRSFCDACGQRYTFDLSEENIERLCNLWRDRSR